MAKVSSSPVLAEAGRFQVHADGTISGPAAYLAEMDQVKVQTSAALMAHAAPAGTTVDQLIAVALQTDFAAWSGAREFGARREA